MSAANFENLCTGFCELARVPSPELGADSDGMLAFHVDWHGVTVNVMYLPSQAREHAFVMFDLGDAQGQPLDEVLILRALLRANFMALQPNPPCFACHPLSGAVVLQCVFPVLDAAPAGLLTLIDEGVTLALQWREGFFIDDTPTPPVA